jgi:hypothetical protein
MINRNILLIRILRMLIDRKSDYKNIVWYKSSEKEDNKKYPMIVET